MLTRRHLLASLAAAPIAAAFTRPAMAATPDIYAIDGVALGGTDPVAYFDGNGPVAGSPDHTLVWRGVEWRFASADAMEAFEMNPEAYAPQYGGYCAYAVSRGYTATTDPDAWTLHDGKLYLNYSKPVRLLWSSDIPGNIAKGDENWPAVLGR